MSKKLNHFKEYKESIIIMLTLLKIMSVSLTSDETCVEDGHRYVFWNAHGILVPTALGKGRSICFWNLLRNG